MKIYPTPGLQTRDPVTKQLLPQEGMEVSDGDLFYAQRLRDGDVTLTPLKGAIQVAASVVKPIVTIPSPVGDKA